MKRALSLLLALSVIGVFLITPVAAANNQGLAWAVASGDRFEYSITTDFDYYPYTSEAFYIVIDNNPATIPNDITTLTQVPTVTADEFWANGTTASILGSGWAVPTGNYTLLGALVEDMAYPGWENIDDVAYWGYKWRTAFFDPEIQMRMEFKYLKSDGTLNTWSISFYNTTSDATEGSFELARTDAGILAMIMDNILYIGIGVGVVVILGAVVCMRRK